MPGLAADLLVTSEINTAIAAKPAFAVEAAGHEALRTFGPKLLEQGIDLLVSSVGALAHEELRTALDAAAMCGTSSYAAIPGAIAGWIFWRPPNSRASRASLTPDASPPAHGKARARKARRSRQDFIGDHLFRRRCGNGGARLSAECQCRGNAGPGRPAFIRRRCGSSLIPRYPTTSTRSASARACADFTMKIEGRVSPDNPKTSMTVAYSMASTILKRLKSG